ncbi:MAG: YibE/F family protein [Candidatus Rifleibacterium amylolyticum]|nr:MAG: YibE/F family protein [Candidatus Rifleibacterium amylolyticum]
MKDTKKSLAFIAGGLILMLAMLFYVFGQTSSGMYATAVIKSIVQQPSIDPDTEEKVYGVDIEFTAGPYAGKVMSTEHFEAPGSIYNLDLEVGQTVLAVAEEQEGQLITGIDEHYKAGRLLFISALLLLLIAGVAGKNGVKAMLALFFTLIIIFGLMARMLLSGWAPIPLTIVAALVIAIVNLLIIAGRTRKGLVAIIGTFSGVVLAGLFGWLAAILLKLTGYTGHESTYLQLLNAELDLRGLLVSGIIIGALGAVMDVSISIASSLLEISRANPGYDRIRLFESGMNIGRDIIGSMVNTLILAYTGASLTLILLFALQKEDFPLIKIMNMEFICAEIVRSLAGLFGMVLAIPVTAIVAAYIYTKNPGVASADKAAEAANIE